MKFQFLLSNIYWKTKHQMQMDLDGWLMEMGFLIAMGNHNGQELMNIPASGVLD